MTLRENPAVAALLGRRSIRRFESREVEEERISLLLECACAAPSAAGTRPWHFVVVRDRGRLDALAQAHPYGKMLFQAPLAVVVCGDPGKSDLARLYWEEDCSAAMENLLVAAHALGLGGVWLGVQHTPQREGPSGDPLHPRDRPGPGRGGPGLPRGGQGSPQRMGRRLDPPGRLVTFPPMDLPGTSRGRRQRRATINVFPTDGRDLSLPTVG